jgi:hypothetical protein
MEQRRIGRHGQTLMGSVVLGAMLVVGVVPVAAHEHQAENGQAGEGQVLANGQNHPRFLPNGDGTFTSCESYGPIPGSSIGPAWYGLETAHHGPDSGDRGKGDGCYVADGSPALGQDDQNPAIK